MRVEINLDEKTLKKLQDMADKENRSRKNYMEIVIINHVKEIEDKKGKK